MCVFLYVYKDVYVYRHLIFLFRWSRDGAGYGANQGPSEVGGVGRDAVHKTARSRCKSHTLNTP